jgi:hypothetical protein
VNAEAVAVGARVDAALVELATAHRERELLAARAAEVFMLVGHVRPRTISPTRPDVAKLARDAEAATMRGPEVPPLLPESFLPAEAEQTMIEPAESPWAPQTFA